MKAIFIFAGAAMLTPGAHATAQDAPANPVKVIAAREVVQEGWAKYDQGNKGGLTPLEFGTWVMAAQGRKARLSPVRVLNATAAAFAKADANHDRLVSRDELTAFLAA